MEHGGDIYGNQNIELDFSVNLSPIGPPEAVLEAINRDDLPGILTCYPDPQYRELRRALAHRLRVSEDWILCGNGASELLMAVAQAVRPSKALIPVPTYQGYERVLDAVDAEILLHKMDRKKEFALTEEIITGLNELAEASCGSGSNSMLFLCNPNNPVGNCTDLSLLNRIAVFCQENQIYLAVDECYLDLLPDAESRTMRHALVENPYLIIINAFTKAYAMPGLRLGYLLTGNAELREKIRLQQPEWSVSMIAQRAGIAALNDEEYLCRARQAVIAERQFVSGKLREFGMTIFDGEAPFVLFHSERELYEPLKEQGILIRRCDGIRGMGDHSETKGHYYRVGLRSHAENAVLMEAIGRFV